MIAMMKWGFEDIPDQRGRVAVVTGANSGLGFYTVRALAQKGCRVIMACRDPLKGEEARQRLLKERPVEEPILWNLDLGDLSSVKGFSDKYHNSMDRLDLLINNAGLMAIPFRKTRDGFEMQFGVNHLGHFALTAQLWSRLKGTTGSRIVNVSSAAHRFGRLQFEDPNWEKGYRKWGAYGMSKLSNLLFTSELDRRISASGDRVLAASAHPGYADTELQSKGALMKGARISARLFNLANRLVAQSAEMGALPSLYAATAEGLEPGGFYGPGGFMRMKGWPAPEMPDPKRVTADAAEKLWVLSESMTGLKFAI